MSLYNRLTIPWATDNDDDDEVIRDKHSAFE